MFNLFLSCPATNPFDFLVIEAGKDAARAALYKHLSEEGQKGVYQDFHLINYILDRFDSCMVNNN